MSDKGYSECPHLEETRLCQPTECGKNEDCEPNTGLCKCKAGYEERKSGYSKFTFSIHIIELGFLRKIFQVYPLGFPVDFIMTFFPL